MRKIIIFEEVPNMTKRIKGVLKDTDDKIIEVSDNENLKNLLENDIFGIDLIIAELDFTFEPEVKLISTYLENHSGTNFIVFTPFLTKKTFLDGLAIGASDYILQTISDEDLKKRLNKYLVEDVQSPLPFNVIIDLRRLLSGEIQKANKGYYELTFFFSSIYDESDREILKEHTTIISKFFSNSYWETDSLIVYGNNNLLSVFPFCNLETIPLVEKKLQHLFAEIKNIHPEMGKYKLVNTYATFPEEGINLGDILQIIYKKIDLKTIK